MSTLNPDQWKALNPYLDQALGMTDEERAEWLALQRAQNPSLAAQLEELLQEHRVLAQENFLEQGPSLPMHASPAVTGQTVGPYTLVSPIGEGGMGSVWLAQRNDGRFERRAAVKFLRTALHGRNGAERFKREGSILGRLAHPHIAQLLDAGVSPAGQPYLVLELVDGPNIVEYCDRHNLSVEGRLRLFLDALAAVAHAHANLIVHRDLKPSNVLVRTDGQVKLLDFGIAKLLEDQGQVGAASPLTHEGGSALTPEYAAPEQVTGSPVTTATDVYGLGVLLYLLLTGQHPAGFGPHSPADLMKSLVDNEPPRMSDTVSSGRIEADTALQKAAQRATTPERLRRLLRGDLDTIVAKALKKNSDERYAAASAMADDLRRFLEHEPISARPDTFAYLAARFVRRNRVVVALGSLALAAMIAGVIGTLVQARAARAERDFALRQVSRAEAISEFDEFLLSDAAPSGKPFTVTELLGRAEQILARQKGDDINRVGLLVSIGSQYATQDEAAKARRVLDEAYKLSRRLSEPSIRAEAACALASSLARDGELPGAEKLFQEGLGELPEQPQFALDRAFCFLRGSEVARERGDSQGGITRVQAAMRVLKQSPFRFNSLDMNTSMDLAEAYRVAGKNREAVSAFEQADRSLAILGRDETTTAIVLWNNWGYALDQLGRQRDAEKIYRRAIDTGRAGRGEETVSPMVLNNYARVLRNLGRLDEAADYAERAYAKATQAGHIVAINQSLLERARIYREQHDYARAEAMLKEVEPRLRKALPPGHYAFASLTSEYSLVALGRRDLSTALKLANEALTMDEAAIKAGGQGIEFLPLLLQRRSKVELDAGQADVAVADATRAVDLLQQSVQPGAFSSSNGRAYLTLGNALKAQGKYNEARSAFRSATEHLNSALGPDHPDSRAAQQLADACAPKP
jgi:serine/threonine-protein kinase